MNLRFAYVNYVFIYFIYLYNFSILFHGKHVEKTDFKLLQNYYIIHIFISLSYHEPQYSRLPDIRSSKGARNLLRITEYSNN